MPVATTGWSRYRIPACARMTAPVGKVTLAIPLTFPALRFTDYASARSPDSRNRS